MLSQLVSNGSSRIHQVTTTASASTFTKLIQRAALSSMVPSWATVNPTTMGTTAEPYAVSNLVGGTWTMAENVMTIPHPMNQDMHPIFTIPDTQVSELGPFLESLRSVPKSGVHNPLKNPERYVQYGEISRRVCIYTLCIAQNRISYFRRAGIRPLCVDRKFSSAYIGVLLLNDFSLFFRQVLPCQHQRLPSFLLNAS
jgi:hypothetical protein